MKNFRQTLGPAYLLSPAQRVQEWMFDNSVKFSFSVILACLWLFVGVFVLMAVIKILGVSGGVWDDNMAVAELVGKPWVWPIRILGVVGIFWYVFKDNFASR